MVTAAARRRALAYTIIRGCSPHAIAYAVWEPIAPAITPTTIAMTGAWYAYDAIFISRASPFMLPRV